MITYDVKGLCAQHGISGPYELAKKVQRTYSVAKRWWADEATQGLNRDTIDLLCATFKCSPADFIIYKPDNKAKGKK